MIQRDERIVVIGAGLAGLRAVERLRRLGYTGALTLIGDEPMPSYDRPPLSKSALADPDAAPVLLRAEADYADLDLDLRRGVAATRLDPATHRVHLDNGNTLDYSRLVIATGSRARSVPGWDGIVNAHVLRTWDDCVRLRHALDGSRHLTVVGAGVLGSEIAATARCLGIEVTLVEPLDAPLVRAAGNTIGRAVADLHRRRGVDVRLGVGVNGFEGPEVINSKGRADQVLLSDGQRIATNNVVVAIGSRANVEWLDGSGLDIADGVICNEFGQTSDPDVFAVGDAAVLHHPGDDRPRRLEHWTSAGDTASLVAANLLTNPEQRKPLVEVPYVWSDFYGVKLQILGIAAEGGELVVLEGDLSE